MTTTTKNDLWLYRDLRGPEPVIIAKPSGFPTSEGKALHVQLGTLQRGGADITPLEGLGKVPAGTLVEDMVSHETHDRVTCTINGYPVVTVRWALEDKMAKGAESFDWLPFALRGAGLSAGW